VKWPIYSVYLRVDELEPIELPDGGGRRVRLLTKGWLPYTLTWDLTVIESRYPHGFTIEATGDFEGAGVWEFQQDGNFVNVRYHWRVRAEQPLLRSLSFVLGPIFEANHRWAMAQGEESLTLELARRRAGSDARRREVPPPPGPTTFAGVALLGAAAAGIGGLAYVLYRARRRSRSRRRRNQTR
jgi:hypothetical protein